MNWFRKFMTGRYGSDQLNLFLDVIAIALLIVGWVTDLGIFFVVAWIPIICILVRSFSRNVQRRRDENLKFLRGWYRVKGFFTGLPGRLRERKKYRHFVCPGCGQQVRVPRGAGHIRITCPRCGTVFEKDA